MKNNIINIHKSFEKNKIMVNGLFRKRRRIITIIRGSLILYINFLKLEKDRVQF